MEVGRGEMEKERGEVEKEKGEVGGDETHTATSKMWQGLDLVIAGCCCCEQCLVEFGVAIDVAIGMEMGNQAARGAKRGDPSKHVNLC